MVPRQSAWKTIHTICFTGLTLFTGEKNKRSASQAQEERIRKNQITHKTRKETEKLGCTTLPRSNPGLVLSPLNQKGTDSHGQLAMVHRISGQRQIALKALWNKDQAVYALSDLQAITGSIS